MYELTEMAEVAWLDYGIVVWIGGIVAGIGLVSSVDGID